MTFHFIKNKHFFYVLSAILILQGVLSFYLVNPALGTDLIGGYILEVKTNLPVETIAKELNIQVSVFKTDASVIIKSKDNLNNLWLMIRQRDKQAEKLRAEFISPALSSELKNKALFMIVVVLFFIGAYIAFAFRRLKDIFSLFSLSLVVIFTLFHDVIATAGIYVYVSDYLNFELDIKFITALLILVGFSVHDTIVIFDRIREKILLSNIKKINTDLKDIFQSSIQETLRRSIFTSLTTVLSILPLTLFMNELRPFLLAIQLGMIVGTYSSICLAAPLLYDSSQSRQSSHKNNK
ncbi:MAG: protein translocase subunit SecF [Candidatus Parcubacteria bacterium]|nr:MAG: protein translocase subunit SecF [Candidatus Parcubacteria bacterium]